ncbi:hypothetical protein Back11_16080 [Paenibacillus baekrokdamisoli]|uniref:Uncharacterized protein n=1 Tax=Paenibacillus baekrokdamisoli TaxID=1712516 RepID=A0A3G9J623_9BACL|nr:hypothetical protein [Paenibacillus baekrokdamisoli]MBB3071958.1 hypothetical protein [Paenibacillus baekrokdamisoli]BBH20263.1 hypothetical protein Back11_16080 [Paenibacillus baekrokdamisoli]
MPIKLRTQNRVRYYHFSPDLNQQGPERFQRKRFFYYSSLTGLSNVNARTLRWKAQGYFGSEAAHSVAASKNYLGAMYRRTAARKGKKRAAINVAHAMLRIAFYLLTRNEMYVDLGEDYFDKQKQQSLVKYAVRRLENLGYSVTISEVS